MKGLALVLIAALLWACDGPFRYPLLTGGELAAETIVFYEHLLLALALAPSFVAQGIRGGEWKWPPLSHLGCFFAIGVGGGALATVCYTRAFTLINPSLVILLQKLQPLVAILLAKWLLKESLSPRFMLWGLLCLLGASLISYRDLSGVGESLNQQWPLEGYLYALVAVVGWGAATVFGKKLTLVGYNTQQIMLGRYMMAIVVLIPAMAASGHTLSISTGDLLQVALMAAISGLLAIFFYYRGLRLISARVCTLAELSYPLWAVLINWRFLDLSIHPLQMLGGGILLLGAARVQWKNY